MCVCVFLMRNIFIMSDDNNAKQLQKITKNERKSEKFKIILYNYDNLQQTLFNQHWL